MSDRSGDRHDDERPGTLSLLVRTLLSASAGVVVTALSFVAGFQLIEVILDTAGRSDAARLLILATTIVVTVAAFAFGAVTAWTLSGRRSRWAATGGQLLVGALPAIWFHWAAAFVTCCQFGESVLGGHCWCS